MAKREWETELRGGALVRKDDKAIVFRGALDMMNALCLQTLIMAQDGGDAETAAQLEDLYRRGCAIMRADALEEPLNEVRLLGLTDAQLRESSHRPQAHLGVGHIIPSREDTALAAAVNVLRACIRQAEIAGVAAFDRGDGQMMRPDILQALNRLSSAAYLIFLQLHV